MEEQLATSPSENLIPFIQASTPLLRELVAYYKNTLPKPTFDLVMNDIETYFDKFTDELIQVPRGPARADQLHRMMDLELKSATQMEVSCKKGCSGCCHFEVEITKDESELLSMAVQHGFSVDMDRLKTQASRERKSAEWLKFWNPQNKCVFLGDNGDCQIYEYRPAICRKLTVVTPASSCTTEGEVVSPVRIPLAEVLLSAALSIPHTPTASMSKMLLASLSISQLPVEAAAPFMEPGISEVST